MAIGSEITKKKKYFTGFEGELRTGNVLMRRAGELTWRMESVQKWEENGEEDN